MDYFFKCLKRGAPRLFFSVLFLLIIGMVGVSPLQGQSLSPGDIAFTGFDSDEINDFATVTLVEISAGTEVHLSSKEWDGSSFSGSGGDLTWVAPAGGVSAGSVLVFNEVGDTPTVNIGSIANDSNIDLSGSGDVIYAYTGADQDNPDTFLGALATSSDKYNGTEGTLNNTGLNEGTTAILLSDNIDVAEYSGVRSGNTPQGYRSLLNNISENWQEENGSGDQSDQILPFDTENFEIVDPPTVRFAQTPENIPEGAPYSLTVELAESNGTEVSVEIVFLSGSSEADLSDISNYTTQTVTFESSDVSGSTHDIAVNLTDDSSFEGDEIAVFQLQNNTIGSIIEPEEFNLNILDTDAPDIVFNEINADPGEDADGNGTTNNDDEFVELVNNTNSDIDISGWKFYNEDDLKHTFPEETVIRANGALVLFSGDSFNPNGNYGAALVQRSNVSSALDLVNGGDTIILRDDQGSGSQLGNIIETVDYPDANNDQSINLDPEADGDTYVNHSTITGANGKLSSPGTKVDGTTWGNGTYAVAMKGLEGWRFVSTPSKNTTFNDLFGDLWTQGATGSNAPSGDPNLFSWQKNGGGSFSNVGNMSNNLAAGQGYIVYVFEDDNYSAPGVQGGFPKIINTSNEENESQINIAVSSSDEDESGTIDGEEGYNLLGNPFGTDLSVDAVIAALEGVSSNVNANVYIWNDALNSGNGGYETLAEGDGETIAPFQAFFVRYTEVGLSQDVTFNRSDLTANQGTSFYKQSASEPVNFELRLGNENKFDTYEVVFDQRGTIGEDRYDAYKLFSLNTDAIQLFSLVGEETRLARNILPALEDLESELRIPVGYDVPESGQYTFGWSELDDIPRRYELHLVDNETGRKINMRNTEDYSFNLTVQEKTQERNRGKISPSLDRDISEANESRFELVIAGSAPVDDQDDEMEQMVTLSPNYPNPFRAGVETRMDMQLRENVHVKVTIWNIVGQKVATLRDEMMPAGDASLSWNAPANMPSGIYICKVEAGGKVITRKMTLVK